MTKPVIVTRLGKGSELTFQEGDDNFTNLQNATISVQPDSGQTQSLDLNDTLQLMGGTGIATEGGVTDNNTITINLENTSVSPNTYSKATITVDAQGRITSASSGSDTITSVNGQTGSVTLTTDNIGEGTNKYFSNSLARGAISAGTGISYDGGTGVISSTITQYSDTNARQAISVTQNLTYNSSTGEITGPNLSGYEQTSNKGVANGYASLDASGLVPSTQLPSYVDDVLEYASQASFPATGESGKIYVDTGTGKTYRWSGSVYVEISASPGTTDSLTEGTTNLYFTNTRARGAISAGTGISYDGGTGVISFSGTVPSSINDLTDVNVTTPSNGQTLVYNSTNSQWENSAPAATVTDLNDLTDVSYSQAGIQAGQILKWNVGAGYARFENYDNNLSGLSDVQDMMSPTNGQVLTYDGTNSYWKPQSLPASGIASVSADTAPSLGGNLTVAGYSIVSTSNGNITIAPNGTGKTIVNNINYYETPYTLTYGATITPNVANGTVQIVTLTGNVTFSAFTSPVAGQSLTLIVKQDATGSRTLTSTMKFTGGTKTLSTAANAVDIISVFYDGTTYWASLATDFK